MYVLVEKGCSEVFLRILMNFFILFENRQSDISKQSYKKMRLGIKSQIEFLCEIMWVFEIITLFNKN